MTIVEPERGGLPERRPSRPVRRGGAPRATGRTHRVHERRTAGDHRTVGLDVGAGVEQGVEHGDVVAARRPVQRRLGVRPGEPGVHVGAELGEHRDGRGAVREVSGPVGDHVHQRSRHAVGLRRIAEPDGRQAGVRLEQRPQRAVSPAWIAATTATATGSSVCMIGSHDRQRTPSVAWCGLVPPSRLEVP